MRTTFGTILTALALAALALHANADEHPEYGHVVYALSPDYGEVTQKQVDEAKAFIDKHGKDSGWQPVGNVAAIPLDEIQEDIAAACPAVPAVLVTGHIPVVQYSTANIYGKHDRSVCPLCYAAYTNDPARVKMASIANDAQRDCHLKADMAARLAPEQIVLKEEFDAARKAFIAAKAGKPKQEARAKERAAFALWKDRRKAPRITVTIRDEGADMGGREVYEVRHPDGVETFYGDMLAPTPPANFTRPRVTIKPPRTKH